MTKIVFLPKPLTFRKNFRKSPKWQGFRNFFLNFLNCKGLGRKTIFVIVLQLETFLSTFHRLVLLIKTINQFLDLDFLLLTGNWEKKHCGWGSSAISTGWGRGWLRLRRRKPPACQLVRVLFGVIVPEKNWRTLPSGLTISRRTSQTENEMTCCHVCHLVRFC